MERMRKIALGYVVSLLLMAIIYPLTFVGLLLLRSALKDASRTLLKNTTRALVAFLASLPLWVAKLFLGISSYHRVFGINPLTVSPQVYNGVLTAFLILQLVLLYFIYLTLRELAEFFEEPYLRTSGLLLMLAVPMHIISINLYLAATYTAITLLAFSFIRVRRRKLTFLTAGE